MIKLILTVRCISSFIPTEPPLRVSIYVTDKVAIHTIKMGKIPLMQT